LFEKTVLFIFHLLFDDIIILFLIMPNKRMLIEQCRRKKQTDDKIGK